MIAADEVGGEAEEQKKPVKEILVVYDQGVFTHETGDTYDGTFEAKKKDRFLKMHGSGMYTTAEGDVYTGNWEADRLTDATINYTDGPTYEGPIKDWCYNGRGKYTYPDTTVLICDFVDNCPYKDMVLTDPNGHIWLGRADVGYGWLDPCNHFYLAQEKKEKFASQEKAVQHS